MTLNFTNVLLLFGIVQSLIMILLIVKTRKWKQPQNSLLIAILLAIAVSLMPPFFGNSKLVTQNDYIRFIPLNLVIFIFPLLFLYFNSIFKQYIELEKKDLAHLIVPIIFWLYYFFIWINTLFYPVEEKGIIAKNLGYFELQFAYNVTLFVMVLGYSWYLFKLIRKFKNEGISKEQLKYSKWLGYLLLFLFIGTVLELTSILLGKIYGYWRSNPIDEWLGFSFVMGVKIYNAILVYIISLIGYNSYATFSVNKSSINSNLIKKYIPLITKAMETNKLYLNKELSLIKMAEELNITSGVLSNALNNHLNISFNDFVNKYRVEEVKNKLQTEDFNHLTLLAIAEDSGFKSKTTFYRAFQKFTSQTPKAYIDILKNRN